MRWQPWPAGNLSPTYAVEGKRPINDFVGAVVRTSIAAGEPVTEARLVLANTRGFMAAVLRPGMRAVSVPVTATSAVSGFIYAGDRVDVLLTHVLNGGDGQRHIAENLREADEHAHGVERDEERRHAAEGDDEERGHGR